MTIFVLFKNNETKLYVDEAMLAEDLSTEDTIIPIQLQNKDMLLLGHVLLETLSPQQITHLLNNRLDSDTPENYDLNLNAITQAIKNRI